MNETTAQPSAFEAGVRDALAAGRARPSAPDPLAATISLAGAVAPVSAEWLEDWKRERDEVSDEFDAAWDAIERRLGPGGRELLSRFEDAFSAIQFHEQDLTMETVCTHLPGIAPGLRAVYQHVIRGGAHARVLGCCATIPTD
jgi:hypothetical protein